jgi:NMD protein affecting ribosome stability and mRNA decay
MTMRKTKRYSLQSLKKKEVVGDPYASTHPQSGFAICPECQSVYHRKRWSLPQPKEKTILPKSPKVAKKSGKPLMLPELFLCPACQKIRDGYAEGFVSIVWDNWLTHKAEIMGFIHNEEKRASHFNPLERIMAIHTRSKGIDIETTTERMAQRIGRDLSRAFKGKVQYKWSHKDKLARVQWKGPTKKAAPGKK